MFFIALPTLAMSVQEKSDEKLTQIVIGMTSQLGFQLKHQTTNVYWKYKKYINRRLYY